MANFYLKTGNTRPVLDVTLKNPDGTTHDPTGADSVTLRVTIDGQVFSRTMTITANLVSYTWLDSDWSSTPALKRGTWPMDYEELRGTARTAYPNDSYDTLVVT